MLQRCTALLVALFACFACTGPGGEPPARSAADESNAAAAPVPVLAAPDPLPEAAWTAPAADPNFQLMTDPGELPYLALAASDNAERLPLEHTHVNASLNG